MLEQTIIRYPQSRHGEIIISKWLVFPFYTVDNVSVSMCGSISSSYDVSEQAYLNVTKRPKPCAGYVPDLFKNGLQFCFFLLFCLHPVYLSCFSWTYSAVLPAHSRFADILARAVQLSRCSKCVGRPMLGFITACSEISAQWSVSPDSWGLSLEDTLLLTQLLQVL